MTEDENGRGSILYNKKIVWDTHKKSTPVTWAHILWIYKWFKTQKQTVTVINTLILRKITLNGHFQKEKCIFNFEKFRNFYFIVNQRPFLTSLLGKLKYFIK
jgi:hypothetical protein